MVSARAFEMNFGRVAGRQDRLLLLPSDDAAALREVRQMLSEALIAVGLRRHVKPGFYPHVTLAYGFSAMQEVPIEPFVWTVRDFVLVESLLDRHRHVERGRWQICS